MPYSSNKTQESRKRMKGEGDTKFGNQVIMNTMAKSVPERKRQAATMMPNPTSPNCKKGY